ncbi:MAG: SDR family NAD(P)-dependent oxidoreductase [Roseiflexaceae bacterium]
MSNATAPRGAVVITGVSTGIGRSTAQGLIARGLRVFGSVRSEADAARLSGELGPAFTPLVFDVTDEAAVRAGAALVRQELGGQRLLGLVNNAGIALAGPLMHQPVAEYHRQIEVNLVAPLIVTQAFLPLLGADPELAGAPGRIVNISSVGGRIAAPFIGAYAASKHGLEGFSESLRRELLLYGIDVIVVAPGAVATPIWEKADQTDIGPYAGTAYAGPLQAFKRTMLTQGRRGLPPERITATIWEALTNPRPRARYAVVPQQLLNWTLPRLLPVRLLDRLFARRLGLRPAQPDHAVVARG